MAQVVALLIAFSELSLTRGYPLAILKVMKAQARKKRQRKLTRLQKWVIVTIPSAIILVLGIIFVAQSSRNTAEQEAERVLSEFPAVISGSWYCENGAPSGIVNDTPWWEEIYVSQVPSDETAVLLEKQLNDKGYGIEKEYIENSTDPYNKDKNYWELTGTYGHFWVEGRIAVHDLTLNNCFSESARVDASIEPTDYASIMVIQFKDNSQ
jgi:hypothetical protein